MESSEAWAPDDGSVSPCGNPGLELWTDTGEVVA